MAEARRRSPHLPIWRDVQKLLVYAETVVRRFPRYHKYTVGQQLREQALTLCRLVLRAQACAGVARLEVVRELHLGTEEFKLVMQLGKEVRAFRSWQEFEDGVELALSVARQAAGWKKALEHALATSAAKEREGVGVCRAESEQLA